MKGRIITIILSVCLLTCVLAACGPNTNEATPTISGGDAVTSSPSPGGSSAGSDSPSPATGTESPSEESPQASSSAGNPNNGENDNVFAGKVTSIDGNKINLSNEGLENIAGENAKTMTITVEDGIPINKSGFSKAVTVEEIKKDDVLIVTLEEGKVVKIYDNGPLNP
jgi:hypothetical protein